MMSLYNIFRKDRYMLRFLAGETNDESIPVSSSRNETINFLPEIVDMFQDYSTNALTKKEKSKILTECTLGDFSKLFERTDAITIMISEFFGPISYKILHDSKSLYEHNLMQYSMQDFFTKEGYSKIFERGYEDESKEAAMTTVNSSANETFRSYIDASLFYENKENNTKLVIQVHYNPYDHRAYYKILFCPKDENFLVKWIEYAKKNNFYKGKKIDANCNFLKINENISWDDVIIPEKVREAIRSNIENMFKYYGILLKNKINIKRGSILSGGPGFGKTMICKALIKESNASVICVLPSHLSSISDIERICCMAVDLAPTLLVIEDIDWLTQSRDLGGNDSVVIELMNKMDGIEDFCGVITVATTNMVDKVEDAIKNRPGRFDRVIRVPLPDEECRRKMLKVFTSSFILDSDVDVEKIIKKCDKLSGAYIKCICTTAAIIAIDEGSIDKDDIAIIKQKHFNNAIKETKDKDFTQLDANIPPPMGFGIKYSDNED
jgi:ATP-dependent 26S proteasome regulatory subunit